MGVVSAQRGGWGGGGGGGGWNGGGGRPPPTPVEANPDTVTVTATATAQPTGAWNGTGTPPWSGSGRGGGRWREDRDRAAQEASAAASQAAAQAAATSATSTAAIVGGTVGALALLAIAAVVTFLLIKRRKDAKKRSKRDTVDLLAEKLSDSAHRDRVLEALNRKEFPDAQSVKGSEYAASQGTASRFGGLAGSVSPSTASQPTYIVLNVPPPAHVPGEAPPMPPPPLSPMSDAFSDVDHNGQDVWETQIPARRPPMPPVPPMSLRQENPIMGSFQAQYPMPPPASRPSMSGGSRPHHPDWV